MIIVLTISKTRLTNVCLMFVHRDFLLPSTLNPQNTSPFSSTVPHGYFSGMHQEHLRLAKCTYQHLILSFKILKCTQYTKGMNTYSWINKWAL